MTTIDYVYIALTVIVVCVTLTYLLGFVLFIALIKRQKEKSGPDNSLLSSKLMGKGNSARLVEFSNRYVGDLKALAMEEVNVTTFDGLKLRGYFIPAEGATVTVICNHGYRSRAFSELSPMATFFHKHGYNVLYVNHRSHGESEGKYIGFGVLDSTDAMKWLEWLGVRVPDDDIFIFGASMGGATTLMTLKNDLPDGVKGLIADCPFTSPYDEFAFQCKALFHLPRKPLLPLASMFCRRAAGYAFDALNCRDLVKTSKLPILFIHGEADTFIPVSMTTEMYDACTSEKELYTVPNAFHCGSCVVNAEEYERVTTSFIEKYRSK